MNSGHIVQKDGVWVVAENHIKKPTYTVPNNVIDIDGTNEYVKELNEWKKSINFNTAIQIHPDHISTVIDNGSVKPEYSGEVVYSIYAFDESNCSVDIEGVCNHLIYEQKIMPYAIPKPIERGITIVESKAGVWEEAMNNAHNYADKEGGGCYMLWEYREHQLNYLKQHYTLTPKK